MTRITHPDVPEPPRPRMFSNARVIGNQFFLSGMHAGTPSGPVGGTDTYAQAVETFRRITALTEACGAEVDDIVSLRIYLIDMDDKAAVGRARADVFTGDFPCSTLLEVAALIEPDLSVEIEAHGFIPSVRSMDVHPV
ncbi:RidA family protein [Rhodococcus sp. G-MC3]|uniref:RidA family protein n=1 Tax=Rhodococcus sp. G-MC3 TaxID=3046209 RepID=UPI0024B93A55|nr:RidA family protein [Rhodococcus sp. G-MC3]MDJ0395048.1 RidA family protein [Rhodococcus sp. G-MC3]